MQNDLSGEENSQVLNDIPVVMHSKIKKSPESESFGGEIFYDVIEEDKSSEQPSSNADESFNSLNSSPKEKVLVKVIFSHQ